MLNHLTTEQRNPDSEAIDSLSALEIVVLMNREDATGRGGRRRPRRRPSPRRWT